MSCAGLVPLIGLAERAGLSELIAERVRFTGSRVKSAGVNPAGKLPRSSRMAAEADSIDDLDAIRSGGMPRLFGRVYAPATLGQFLREFTHGHTLQLASVLRAHLVSLVEYTDLLPGIGDQVFIDIDSLLRPVFGHAKQGASYGHTKIAGKQVLRKGLSPLATILSTRTARRRSPGSAARRPRRLGKARRRCHRSGPTARRPARPVRFCPCDAAYGNHAVSAPASPLRPILAVLSRTPRYQAIGTIPDHA